MVAEKQKKATKKAKESAQTEAKTEEHGPKFLIQRIYTKDISFESPNSPKAFKEQWQPQVNLQVNTTASVLDANQHEVVLKVTVTAKQENNVVFLVEVQQAGIFTIESFEGDQKKHVVGSYCPNILFPFAREVVSDLIARGGFPPLYLAPINFDALYKQQQEHATTE